MRRSTNTTTTIVSSLAKRASNNIEDVVAVADKEIQELKDEIEEFRRDYGDVISSSDLRTLRTIKKILTVGTVLTPGDYRALRPIRGQFMWGAFNLMQRYRFLRENLTKNPKIIIEDDDNIYGASYRLKKEMSSYEVETCVNTDNVDELKKEIDEFCIEYEDILPDFKLKTLRNMRKLMTVGAHISDTDMKISRNIRKRFKVGVYILTQRYQDLGERLDRR